MHRFSRAGQVFSLPPVSPSTRRRVPRFLPQPLGRRLVSRCCFRRHRGLEFRPQRNLRVDGLPHLRLLGRHREYGEPRCWLRHRQGIRTLAGSGGDACVTSRPSFQLVLHCLGYCSSTMTECRLRPGLMGVRGSSLLLPGPFCSGTLGRPLCAATLAAPHRVASLPVPRPFLLGAAPSTPPDHRIRFICCRLPA